MAKATTKRKRGRPPGPTKRGALGPAVQVRISEQTMQAISSMAEEEQRSLAQMVRILLDRQLEEMGEGP